MTKNFSKTYNEARHEFNQFFRTRNMASTYKPFFLKCILELTDYDKKLGHFYGKQWIEKKDNGLQVDLEFIASRFGLEYWDHHFKFRLKQSPNKKDVAIYRLLEDFRKSIDRQGKIPKITVFCNSDNSSFRKKIISQCIKPDVLERLKKDCNIYKVSEDRNSIFVPNSVIEFLKENKTMVLTALNFVITSYLEMCNESPQIATKISKKTPPPKIQQEKFNYIKKMQNNLCFYCTTNSIDVQEHVIPKDYVWETKPFNIVGSCEKCNREKWYDRLPKWKIFLKVLDRNDSLGFSQLIKNEDYSREGYISRYKTCRSDYASKKKLWEPGS